MKRTIAAATLLLSLSAAASAFAQYPPQQYPPQQYPPQQQYAPPQQGYQQPGYQAQPYQQAQMSPVPQSYAPVGPSAGGAAFGSRGQVILSADRLFGLSFWSSKTDLDNNASFTASGTAINLLWGDTGDISGPYATPRLGLDFTAIDNLSVGGSLGLISRTGKTESSQAGNTLSTDSPTVTGFAFAPRVGYILGINPMIGVWFKGGITYYSLKTESTVSANGQSQTTTDTFNGFSLNIEPELVITPVPHFGLTIGGVADIPLSGNAKRELSGATAGSEEHPNKVTNFGIIAGLLGYI
jgi:opacity protein-like surface antigen